jgi:hypothetical protein
MGVDEVYFLAFEKRGEPRDRQEVVEGADRVLEIRNQMHRHARGKGPGFRVEHAAFPGHQDHFEYFSVVVLATVEGVLLRPTQLEAGDDVSHTKRMSVGWGQGRNPVMMKVAIEPGAILALEDRIRAARNTLSFAPP